MKAASIIPGFLIVCGVALGQLSLSYSSGQKVSPAFEGWDQNPDGSFNMIFGYMNQNWEEELDVPVGPANNFQPGPADQGQPAHFYPRRNRFVFEVRVPKDFGEKELVWTLTTHGKTVKAYGTLKADYFVDDMVRMSETGALGAGVSSPEIRRNKPPVVEAVGDSVRLVKVGEALTLYAHVSDDGIPKARQRDAGAFSRRGERRRRLIFGCVHHVRLRWAVPPGCGLPYFCTGAIRMRSSSAPIKSKRGKIRALALIPSGRRTGRLHQRRRMASGKHR